MSGLYQLRKEIAKLLLQDGLWSAGEVLIKRRANIWNDISVAADASEKGQCIVVGVAKGVPAKGQGDRNLKLQMELTIPITLIELPRATDEEDIHEDERWEATVKRLQGSPLGRSAQHYALTFDSFADVEDDEYVIRQTVFKTTLLLQPA